MPIQRFDAAAPLILIPKLGYRPQGIGPGYVLGLPEDNHLA